MSDTIAFSQHGPQATTWHREGETTIRTTNPTLRNLSADHAMLTLMETDPGSRFHRWSADQAPVPITSGSM